MSLLEKFKDGFWSHIGSACAAALVALFGWLFYQIAPALLPAMEAAIAPRVGLAILLLSALLNAVLVVIVWHMSRPQSLRLKFGILWDKDKNPHCPSCKNGGLTYGEYRFGEVGYYCNTCQRIFHLADAHGNYLLPADVLPQI